MTFIPDRERAPAGARAELPREPARTGTQRSGAGVRAGAAGLGRPELLDQGQDAVADALVERDLGPGAGYAGEGQEGLDDFLQVQVAAGRHPAEQVAFAGRGVCL